MFSVELAQEELIAYLETSFIQPVVEQAIPDSKTVKRNTSGAVIPYIAFQFSDLSQGRTTSMVGPRGDDYNLVVNAQAVADTPKTARRMANKLNDVMLGFSPDWSGEVRKRAGGGMFPMIASNSATEAYMFPCSFSVAVEISNET